MVYLVLGEIFGFKHRWVALDSVDVVRLFLFAEGLYELLNVIFKGMVIDIVGLHADNRLYSCFLGSLVEVDSPAHISVVCHCDCRHAELFNPID